MASDYEFEGGYNPHIPNDYLFTPHDGVPLDSYVQVYYDLLLRLEDPSLNKDELKSLREEAKDLKSWLLEHLPKAQRKLFRKTLAEYRRNRNAFYAPFVAVRRAARDQIRAANSRRNAWRWIEGLPDHLPNMSTIYTGAVVPPTIHPRKFGPRSPTIKQLLRGRLETEKYRREHPLDRTVRYEPHSHLIPPSRPIPPPPSRHRPPTRSLPPPPFRRIPQDLERMEDEEEEEEIPVPPRAVTSRDIPAIADAIWEESMSKFSNNTERMMYTINQLSSQLRGRNFSRGVIGSFAKEAKERYEEGI